MIRHAIRLWSAGLLLFLIRCGTFAQPMPQDTWFFSHKFGSFGQGNGQLYQPRGVAVSADGLVYVADYYNNRIQVFDSSGNFVRKWGSQGAGDGQLNYPYGCAVSPDGKMFVTEFGGCRVQVFASDGTFVRKWGAYGAADGQFANPRGIAISPDGYVFVADSGNNRIQVFSADGTFIRAWGTSGTLDGEFSTSSGVAVSRDGEVYVTDYNGNRIQVFKPDGTFLRKWGTYGGNAGQFFWPTAVAVAPNGLVIVTDMNNSRLQIFEPDGTFVRLWRGSGSSEDMLVGPEGVAVSLDGRIVVSEPGRCRIQVFDKAEYRVCSQPGEIPEPLVLNCSQRPVTPYLDVDYTVWDRDSPTVTVAFAAFQNGTNSLKNFIKVNTFEDGTAAFVGTNIAANVTNRVCWNVAADLQADYVSLKVSVMAKDERGLLAVDYISLPASGTNAALTISRSPISQADMLPLWFWLLARNDSDLTLSQGKVYGVGGAYAGVVLADQVTTTAAGRGYLFQRLGVREATVAELSRARTGPSGVVNQWTPRVAVGPGDRPKAVNEYGFDTGNWGSDGWWVVRE